MRCRACLVAIVLGTATAAFAQPQLSLSQAIQEALSNNRSIQAAHSSVREADARIVGARSAFFPRISVVESWQRGDQPIFVFSALLSSRRFAAANFAIDSLNAPDPTGLFHASVGFEQIVFDGGRTRAAVDSSALQRDMAALAADDQSAAVVVAVVEVYGRILSARAAGGAADAAVAAAEEDLARARLRREAGSLNQADVLAVALHLSAAQRRRTEADGDHAVAKAELNRLMGAAIDRDYEVAEPAMATDLVREARALPVLMAEAESQHAGLKRAETAEHMADAGRRSARASWYPQIAAQGAVDANGLRAGDRASSWVIGGELRWTLSSGGAEAAQRTAATEATVRARLEHEDARAAVQVEIASTVRRLNTALARRDAAQAAVDYARESQRIVRDRFEAGLAGTSDLLRAASAAFDADTERAAAAVDVMVSRARLDRAIGRPPLAFTRQPS